MWDQIDKLNNSLIHHGKQSDRLYLMKLDVNDLPDIINDMDKIVETNEYTKIFAKVPADKINVFMKNGYLKEAAIPGFFNGSNGCVFLAKYFSKNRKTDKKKQEITKVMNVSVRKSNEKKAPQIYYKYSLLKATEADAVELSDFYNQIFDTYPFPIGNPNYLRDTMKSHIDYYLIRDPNKIIAASSVEIDCDANNAELTDFGTLPEYRGKNLSGCLLSHMESEMAMKGIITLYTIARALSFGINITFSKKGYNFGGTLINNTSIAGQIESMNVWYKKIEK